MGDSEKKKKKDKSSAGVGDVQVMSKQQPWLLLLPVLLPQL
jgi:hypothetical protein